MPILALRTQQATSTTGTGTVLLNTVAAGRRSFQQAFGAGVVRISYVISGASFFEIGLGDYDGGTPGTLSRVSVLASSSAGALVSLPAGTADVFTYLDPAQRGVLTGTGAVTLTGADLGNVVIWSGTTANTIALPAVAAVPSGLGYLIINRGTATLTIDPNAAEQINAAATMALLAGESAECYQSGAAWVVTSPKAGTTLSTLAVTGAATVGTTLGVTGATTLASVAVTGAATVGTTLAVTGATTLSSTLAVTGAATAANGTTGTQLVNFSQFPATIAATGTTTLPNGLIIKWGTWTIVAGNSTASVTFATAFPTALANFQSRRLWNTGPGDISDTTRTGFTLSGGDGVSASSGQWLAIGY